MAARLTDAVPLNSGEAPDLPFVVVGPGDQIEAGVEYGYGYSPVKSLYAPDPTFMPGLIAFTVVEGEMDVEPLAYSDANEIVNAPPSIPETESIPKDAWFCPQCRNWHDDQTLARCPSCDRRRAGH